jgi:hypothetical protein
VIVALAAWLLGVGMGAAVVFWALTSTRIAP